MMPNLQFTLNQQFQQGVYFVQQAMMAEQMGNLPAAAPCYDQAIALIGNAIAMASQSGIPVLDNVYFSYAFCNFNAARVKAALGMPQAAPLHLSHAYQAMQQALAMNPGFFAYHSAFAVVLLAQGNVAAAVQEFQRAVQLNPADGFSQWMLSSLYTSQGNTAMANQYYAAAQQAQPNLPPPQQYVQPAAAPAGGGSSQSKHDWFELISNGLKLANSIAGAFQSGGGGGGGASQMPDWGQGGGWNPGNWGQGGGWGW